MRAGIIYHGLLREARDLAGEIADRYSGSGDWWLSAAEDASAHAHELEETDMLVTIGGDGTILMAVQEAAPRKIPIIGVNLGRVGFMSEIEAEDALDGLGWYLDGNARVDERPMIQAMVAEPDSEDMPAFVDSTSLEDRLAIGAYVMRIIAERQAAEKAAKDKEKGKRK